MRDVQEQGAQCNVLGSFDGLFGDGINVDVDLRDVQIGGRCYNMMRHKRDNRELCSVLFSAWTVHGRTWRILSALLLRAKRQVHRKWTCLSTEIKHHASLSIGMVCLVVDVCGAHQDRAK
jgi:hypothetical protein